MKNSLMKFENSLFGEIRVIEIEGKPHFVGIDIAKALGYIKPNNAVNNHCKHATLKQGIITDSLGRLQDALVIPEGDVYRLISKSKLPQAEKFESWVFDEVLPQIRQTGGYISVTEQDDDLTIMSKALMIAQNTLAKKDELIEQKEQRIIELEPKANYYDSVLQPKNLITVTQIAKDLGMSAIQLNNLLNSKGIIYKKGSTWYPYSNYNWLIEDGYADYAMGVTGVGMSHQLLKWTERGRQWIIETVLTSM